MPADRGHQIERATGHREHEQFISKAISGLIKGQSTRQWVTVVNDNIVDKGHPALYVSWAGDADSDEAGTYMITVQKVSGAVMGLGGQT